MAYKFNQGTFNISPSGSAAHLAIAGDLKADNADGQTINADDIAVGGGAGNIEADVLIQAANIKVKQDSGNQIANNDQSLQINNASSQILAEMHRTSNRAAIDLNNAGNNRVSLRSGVEGTASSVGQVHVKNSSAAIRVAVEGGEIQVHRNLSTTGNATITDGGGGNSPTMVVGGQLSVGGDTDATVGNVTILDKQININADATTRANSDGSALEIGKSSGVNTAKLSFGQAAGRLDVLAGDGSYLNVLCNPIGDGSQLTGIPPALSFTTATDSSPSTNTLSAADAGKVQILSGNGAYVINMPASAGLTIGQIFKIKAGANCSETNTITINRNGSDVFGSGTDGNGTATVILDSPFAMVELVYIGSLAVNGNTKTRFAIL